MRSESGMGRSRNLLTPWAHRKRNIATVTFKSQFVRPNRVHCPRGKTVNMVQPPPTRIRAPWGTDSLQEETSVSPESAQRLCGCAAPVLTCVGSQTWGKKERFALWAALFIFFFQTQVQLQTRLSGKLAWQHQHVAPLLQQHPCVLTLWVQVWACGCQLMNYSVKILQMAKSSDRARK